MSFEGSLSFICLLVCSCRQSSDIGNAVTAVIKPSKFDIYIGYCQSNLVGSTFSKLTLSYPSVECGS